MGFLFRPTPAMVRRDEALPGRATSVLAAVAPEHLVFGIPVEAISLAATSTGEVPNTSAPAASTG